MKKIYISGKISGECETPEAMIECKAKFKAYAINYGDNNVSCHPINHTLFLGDVRFFHYRGFLFTSGFEINRLTIPLAKQLKLGWQGYMKNDIACLITCDEAHFLPDWKDSRGAKIEHQLCIDLGIKIVYG